MHRGFLMTAAILGAIAVALGAFGAHGLKSLVSSDLVAVWETGVRYQFYHTFALLATGIIYREFSTGVIRLAGVLFTLGILLFSGSVYMTTFVVASGHSLPTAVALITPFGGIVLIAAWICLIIGLIDSHSRKV